MGCQRMDLNTKTPFYDSPIKLQIQLAPIRYSYSHYETLPHLMLYIEILIA